MIRCWREVTLIIVTRIGETMLVSTCLSFKVNCKNPMIRKVIISS